MNNRFKITLIFLLLTITGIIILYYESNIKTTNNNDSTSSLQKSVNATVSNMELIIQNTDGTNKAKLMARSLNHKAEENLTVLTSPNLILTQPSASWTITSNTGVIIHHTTKLKQIDEIVLSENVVITRHEVNSANLPLLTLKTTSMSYYPKDDVMKTSAPVTIETKESITTADGLEFYKQDQKLKLLHNVKTVYKANNSNSLKLKKLAKK